MKVLFDHNLPQKARGFLAEHEVSTAFEMGWAELENGELLEAAEAAGFGVMVTADKNISYQQNLEGRLLSLVVLSTNNWNVIKPFPERLSMAVNSAVPGALSAWAFEHSIQWQRP